MPPAVFTKCASEVTNFIRTAQKSLQIAVCWFTHPGLYSECIKACKRGVRVQILVNYDQINFHPGGLDFEALEGAGAEVFGYPGPGLIHYKFAIADRGGLLSGSFNWTRTEQHDHVAVSIDEALVAAFLQAFEQMTGKCLRLSRLQDIPVQHVHFQQLFKPVCLSPADLRKQIISGKKAWLVIARSEQEWRDWVDLQRIVFHCKHPLRHLRERDFQQKQIVLSKIPLEGLSSGNKNHLLRFCFRLKEGDVLLCCTKEGGLLGAGILAGMSEMPQPETGEIFRFVQWIPLKAEVRRIQMASGSGKAIIRPYRQAALALVDLITEYYFRD